MAGNAQRRTPAAPVLDAQTCERVHGGIALAQELFGNSFLASTPIGRLGMLLTELIDHGVEPWCAHEEEVEDVHDRAPLPPVLDEDPPVDDPPEVPVQAPPDPLQVAQDKAANSANADWAMGGVSTRGANADRVDAIIKESGFQNYFTDGLQWCGMFVAAHYRSAGLDADLRKGFYHVANVEHFFTYQWETRVPRAIRVGDDWRDVREYHNERGSVRTWMNHGQIESAVAGGNYGALDIRPGDVVLIDHEGNGSADHITMVQSWDPSTGMLVTVEGNASGQVVSTRNDEGEVTATKRLNTGAEGNGVTINERSLAPGGQLVRIYGVGRPSAVDFEEHDYSNG